jgi:hypothetical protein
MIPSSDASHRSGCKGLDLILVRPFHAGHSERRSVMAPGNDVYPDQPRRRRRYLKAFRNDAAAAMLDEPQETG